VKGDLCNQSVVIKGWENDGKLVWYATMTRVQFRCKN